MKELIVVLGIAGVVFLLAKPIAIRFSEDADFARRRNVWVALTIVAFLSPNFWAFAFFAIPIYLWAGRKDSNPIGAYLLFLHVVPPTSVEIPPIGVAHLFSLDNYRLLSFCILVPTAYRARKVFRSKGDSASRITDVLFLAFGVVQMALFVPPDLPDHVILQDSATNLLRRVFLYSLDVLVLYYAISRSCADRRKIIDSLASFCISGAIMAVVATFEHFKGWLLYTELATRWNPADTNYQLAWLLRGNSWLRSQASAGHALALGFLLTVALGFWLFLQSRITSARTKLAISVVFWLGMLASFSRGPWIGAVLVYLAYAALKPRAISRVFKAVFLIAIVLGLLSLTPIGDKLVSSLNVTGSHSDADFSYRQRLVDRSLELIEAHPWFGDQLAVQKMQDLRQGQGIIDIVNTYVGVAVFSGCVGLALFLGLILSATIRVFNEARRVVSIDPSRGLLGFDILACTVGALFMIADCSFILGVEKMFYVLIALCAAYVRQDRLPPPGPAKRNGLTPQLAAEV